jgi:hypothetical protein
MNGEAILFIQISPSALKEFLFGDWNEDRYKTIISRSPIAPIEGLLFRLIFKTIQDFLTDCYFLDSRHALVEHLYFGEIERDGQKESTLLTLELRDGRRLRYEGGFDTNIPYVGLNDEDIVPLLPNKENAHIRTIF